MGRASPTPTRPGYSCDVVLHPVSGLFDAVETELRFAVPNQPLPAQASVGFFEQTVAGVFHDDQGLRIEQM
ncbi:hypothetical protein SBA2_520021 [Acidobacteriia bacterium SbA2]|nr:hypothetical protein SBA2_520021 [Acidobacteriia bacterium SbA2]